MTESVAERTAACCCGEATISVAGDPEFNLICHCNNCRARTGSAFGWSAYFASEQILGQTGNVACYQVGGDFPHKRYFCKNCGTTLYWTTNWQGNMTGIAGGCFTQDPLPEPQSVSSHENRCRWLALPENWKINS